MNDIIKHISRNIPFVVVLLIMVLTAAIFVARVIMLIAHGTPADNDHSVMFYIASAPIAAILTRMGEGGLLGLPSWWLGGISITFIFLGVIVRKKQRWTSIALLAGGLLILTATAIGMSSGPLLATLLAAKPHSTRVVEQSEAVTLSSLVWLGCNITVLGVLGSVALLQIFCIISSIGDSPKRDRSQLA